MKKTIRKKTGSTTRKSSKKPSNAKSKVAKKRKTTAAPKRKAKPAAKKRKPAQTRKRTAIPRSKPRKTTAKRKPILVGAKKKVKPAAKKSRVAAKKKMSSPVMRKSRMASKDVQRFEGRKPVRFVRERTGAKAKAKTVAEKTPQTDQEKKPLNPNKGGMRPISTIESHQIQNGLQHRADTAFHQENLKAKEALAKNSKRTYRMYGQR